MAAAWNDRGSRAVLDQSRTDQDPIVRNAGVVVHNAMADSPLICVVDDDASILRALHRLLRSGNYAVKTFPSAEAFLASEYRPIAGCLVLDVHLGGLSGIELQEQLIASGIRTPVVFITAHDDVMTRERARRAGAIDYLRKPFDDSALLQAVDRALAGR
jgi:FixJ family two-component response regulator